MTAPNNIPTAEGLLNLGSFRTASLGTLQNEKAVCWAGKALLTEPITA
jgi:hypothetical protein